MKDELALTGLCNWNSKKGNPFDYDTCNCKSEDIISVDTEWEIVEKSEQKKKLIKEISFNHHLKTLSTINQAQSDLIQGTDNNGLIKYIDKELDINKPVIVYLNYPFKKTVKVTIYPLVRIFKGAKTDSTYISHIGYYAWQIAKIYADIYKNHWKEVGIWGHGFSDLFLEGIEIYEKNTFELHIGS